MLYQINDICEKHYYFIFNLKQFTDAESHRQYCNKLKVNMLKVIKKEDTLQQLLIENNCVKHNWQPH